MDKKGKMDGKGYRKEKRGENRKERRGRRNKTREREQGEGEKVKKIEGITEERK